jgi:CxxC-x17-CxxC domain-containing protein
MKDFKKSGGYGNKGGSFEKRDGGRPSFGGKPSFSSNRFDRGSDRPAMMHKATCAECGKTCEVPFRPNGEKPVYCNDCFGDKREGTFNNDRPQKRDFAPARPAFRPDREDAPRPDRRIDDLKLQVEKMNAKIDQLMTMMTAPVAKAPAVHEKAAKPVAVKKVAEKKVAVKKAAKPAAAKAPASRGK